MQKHSLSVVKHAAQTNDDTPLSCTDAINALAALGQATRLEIFTLLMRHEPAGLAAGAIAEAIGCPQNTLSTHMGILARAALVRGVRQGRFIFYHADVDGMRGLLKYLVKDCCGGHPELCGLADGELKSGCCPPTGKSGAKTVRKPTTARR